MLLKNKLTGDVVEIKGNWEDYEEPKEYWYIRDFSITRGDTKCIGYSPEPNSDTAEYRKQIGNYFETEEEAEKAVEKLKAWKRLKDKGFRFDGYDFGHNSNRELCGQSYFKAGDFWFGIKEDLDLLFGGKNE